MERADADEISGASRQASRERAFRLLAATVTALFVTFTALAGLLLWHDNAARMVMHTYDVRQGIADMLQALSEAESAQRGYLLTSRPEFLGQVDSARHRGDASLGTVERLTIDNPAQQRRIMTLRPLMAKRLDVIDRTLRLAKSGDHAAAVALIEQGEGLAAMATVRQLLSQLDRVEAGLEAKRLARARILRTLSIVSLVVFSLLLSALFIKAIRDISLDREAESEAAEHLRELVAQRTLLLDEVNHRVKNSLQQIASVVRLQARAADHEAVRTALDKALARIMAVGRVHERMYKSDQLGLFDAGAYAEALARELVDSLARDDVALAIDVEPVMLDMRQAGPIALILNELVTNALKYGCPEDRACRIRVALRTFGANCRLSVSDEGEGLPENFSITSKAGLGMRAVDALAKQLGGQLRVEPRKAGAAFAVEFPLGVV